MMQRGRHCSMYEMISDNLRTCVNPVASCFPLQVARCTKIINPNTDEAKYVINVKQIAKFVVGLGDKVAPTDIEEGMRVGVDRTKYQVCVSMCVHVCVCDCERTFERVHVCVCTCALPADGS